MQKDRSPFHKRLNANLSFSRALFRSMYVKQWHPCALSIIIISFIMEQEETHSLEQMNRTTLVQETTFDKDIYFTG